MKSAEEFAGQLHDAADEVGALFSMDGKDIGWAPEEAIPVMAELIAARDAEHRAELLRWKKAVLYLTPGGSEYVDDPERCAEAIQHRVTVPQMVIALRTELEAAKKQIAEHRAETAAMLGKLSQEAHDAAHKFYASANTTTGDWFEEFANHIELDIIPTDYAAALMARDAAACGTGVARGVEIANAEHAKERERLAKRWRDLAGNPKDWVTPGNEVNTAILTAGRATMIQCAEELEKL